ncbi:oligopeptide/dipeptide ABC transporter ATP-binding protein, partial [Streptomyces sp. NPDC001274]
RVGVMYLGRIVETGTDEQIYEHPTHPYTQALLSAVPVPDPAARAHRERIILHGDVPSPANPPSGCRFRTRCWKAQDRCALEVPLLAVPAVFRLLESPAAHDSACHFAEEKRVVPPEGLLGVPAPPAAEDVTGTPETAGKPETPEVPGTPQEPEPPDGPGEPGRA